jgi:hypothetical protein
MIVAHFKVEWRTPVYGKVREQSVSDSDRFQIGYVGRSLGQGCYLDILF